jgi:iron complex transport system permease protein
MKSTIYLMIAFILLCVFFLLDLMTGSLSISPTTVLTSLFYFDGTTEHQVIHTIRLPRAIIALTVGSCLAVSGAVMQALTRNPIASPDILGIHSGSAFLIVIAMFIFQVPHMIFYNFVAFLGAALAAGIVFVLSSSGSKGMTPVKLVLSGAIVTLFITSCTQGILLLNERSMDDMRFWLAGSIAGRDMQQWLFSLPFIIFGLSLSLIISKQMNLLQLGDDLAVGLGQKTKSTKTFAFICIVLLTGSSVAIAGPITFIGLAVPHIVRSFVGLDYKWIIIHSSLYGAIFLLLADITSKLIIHPNELPIGVVTVLFGAPFFIYLVRKRRWGL